MFNPNTISRVRDYAARAIRDPRPHRLSFGPPMPTGEISLEDFKVKFLRAQGMTRAADKLREDIAMGMDPEARKPSEEIPEPYCLWKGQFRETISLNDDEKIAYHEYTNQIRQGKANWKILMVLQPDRDWHPIVVEHYRDLALRDLYDKGVLENTIPALIPGITRRAQDFLKITIKDEDLRKAVQDVQRSVRIGLKNALRLSEGQLPVEVPVEANPPGPLFLLRGTIKRKSQTGQPERRAYMEDMIQIRAGHYDWDYLVIVTVETLRTFYPDEAEGVMQDQWTPPPRTPCSPSLRDMVEAAMAPSEVLGVRFNYEFQLPGFIEQLLKQDFVYPYLKGAVDCLGTAIRSGESVIKRQKRVSDVPDIFLAYPFTYFNGRLVRTAKLSEEQKVEWKREMAQIATGRCNWSRLEQQLEEDKEANGHCWQGESNLRRELAGERALPGAGEEREWTRGLAPPTSEDESDSTSEQEERSYRLRNIWSTPSHAGSPSSSYSAFFRTPSPRRQETSGAEAQGRVLPAIYRSEARDLFEAELREADSTGTEEEETETFPESDIETLNQRVTWERGLPNFRNRPISDEERRFKRARRLYESQPTQVNRAILNQQMIRWEISQAFAVRIHDYYDLYPTKEMLEYEKERQEAGDRHIEESWTEPITRLQAYMQARWAWRENPCPNNGYVMTLHAVLYDRDRQTIQRTMGALTDVFIHRSLNHPRGLREEEGGNQTTRWDNYASMREAITEAETDTRPSEDDTHNRSRLDRYMRSLTRGQLVNRSSLNLRRTVESEKPKSEGDSVSTQAYQAYIQAKQDFQRDRTEENRRRMTELGRNWVETLPAAELMVFPANRSVEASEVPPEMELTLDAQQVDTGASPVLGASASGEKMEAEENPPRETGAVPKRSRNCEEHPEGPSVEPLSTPPVDEPSPALSEERIEEPSGVARRTLRIRPQRPRPLRSTGGLWEPAPERRLTVEFTGGNGARVLGITPQTTTITTTPQVTTTTTSALRGMGRGLGRGNHLNPQED